MNAIAMGVHVLDVLVRPVEEIPEGQGGQLVEEIRVTPAGSAGGTARHARQARARTCAARARSAPTPPATCCSSLLERDGVDTSLLVRRDDVQTSASVLPIRPERRPAGLPRGRRQRHLRRRRRARGTRSPRPTHLHLGGPEFMGGEAAAQILSHAREHGVVTSADVLAPGEPGLLEWIAAALPGLDYLLPNDEQVLAFTGAGDLVAGAAARWSSAAWAAWPPPAAPMAC